MHFPNPFQIQQSMRTARRSSVAVNLVVTEGAIYPFAPVAVSTDDIFAVLASEIAEGE